MSLHYSAGWHRNAKCWALPLYVTVSIADRVVKIGLLCFHFEVAFWTIPKVGIWTTNPPARGSQE
jgi:hypothetical protein